MNCRAENRRIDRPPALREDISRVDALWSGLRRRNAGRGEWLFGDFTIADCMYAPLAIRFRTYGADLSALSQTYVDRVLAHPCVQAWLEQARLEPETIAPFEVGA